MRRSLICLFVTMVFLTGCIDKRNIEDVSLVLLVGIDLDENNDLLISASSPVFNKEATVKEEFYQVKAMTLRQSRDEFDKVFSALPSAAKTQVIMIGKRVLEHEDWFPLLDVFYRDARNTVNATVVMVDGTVYDIVSYLPKNKPRLPMYMTKLIRTVYYSNLTVKTSLQELRRQMIEKGITASITQMQKKEEVVITGTALLDQKGKHVLSIDGEETKLLHILQNKTQGVFSFTLTHPVKAASNMFKPGAFSFSASGISAKTKVSHKDGKLKFDIEINMTAVLTDRHFKIDVRQEAPRLEREIAEILKSRFERLIGKARAAKIDPFGYGLYARAFAYDEWKKVQDRWGDAFSEADVNVNVKIKIGAMGPIH
jgi:Ger(x)C family germination protein